MCNSHTNDWVWVHGSTFFVCTVFFSLSRFFAVSFCLSCVAIPPAVLECCAALFASPRSFRWSKKLVSQNAFVISQWQSWNIKWTHRWSIHSIYELFSVFFLPFFAYIKIHSWDRSTAACVNCTNESAFALNDVCFNPFRFLHTFMFGMSCEHRFFRIFDFFSRASPLPPMRFYCCCSPTVRRVGVQR